MGHSMQWRRFLNGYCSSLLHNENTKMSFASTHQRHSPNALWVAIRFCTDPRLGVYLNGTIVVHQKLFEPDIL
jgi:hypothetical protein